MIKIFLFTNLHSPHPINPAAIDIMMARKPVIICPAVETLPAALSVCSSTFSLTTLSSSKRLSAVKRSLYLSIKSITRPFDQPKPS